MFCFWPLHLIAPALLLHPSLPLFASTLVGEPLRAEGSEVPPFHDGGDFVPAIGEFGIA